MSRMMSYPYNYKRLCKLSWKERKELNRIVRKQKKNRDAYAILFNANNKTFVNNLSAEEREWLKNIVKNGNAEADCLCCPCFAWDVNEDLKICGCTCTLGGVPNPDGKGDCVWMNSTST